MTKYPLSIQKAQAKLALTMVDSRIAPALERYIEALEKLVDAGKKLSDSIHPSTDPENRYYDIDPQDWFDYVEATK